MLDALERLYVLEVLDVLKVWEILEVPRLYTEDDILLLCTEERLCSLHNGESVPLLSLKEADSLSRERRECLLYTKVRVYRCLM